MRRHFGIRFYNSIFLLVLLLSTFVSCSDDDASRPSPKSDSQVLEQCVAVVAPLGDAATKTRLERTAQWLAENLTEVQRDDTIQVRLKLEWYDELNEDLATLSRQLAAREDVRMVVGPFGNESMAVFAPECQKVHKPLIAPTVTSENILRRYAVASAGKGDEVNKEAFFWPLCVSDASLAETVLSHYVTGVGESGATEHLSCAVFSPADSYGQTFYDWLPFYAENMNVTLRENTQYTTENELASSIMDYLNQSAGHDTLGRSFCIAETTRQILDVAQAHRAWLQQTAVGREEPERGLQPFFIFPSLSEEGISNAGKQSAETLQGYEGFTPYADPTTGFEQAYEERFGTKPTFAECKFYDALLLAALASYFYHYIEGLAPNIAQQLSPDELSNTNIHLLGTPSTNQPGQPVWRGTALRAYLDELKNFARPALLGASGYIIFDEDNYTQIAPNTYVLWQIDNGEIHHLTYYGPNGRLAEDTSVSWVPTYDEDAALKNFADMAAGQDLNITYPALDDQYAVLVQGSNGMSNYRHQADVLMMYQLLRRSGFDDDHIILILDGALAHDPQNSEPGVIRYDIFSHDLMGGTDQAEIDAGLTLFTEAYPAAVVDYDTDSLTATDVTDILLGKQSAHLPIVLPTETGLNVLFYWSGHGRSQAHGGCNELVWRDTAAGQGFTAERMRQTVETMQADGHFLKLLAILEPCYSEAVIRPLEGITGVLAMSGASGSEQSWAENWNQRLGRYGTWMCDRFTLNVVRCLSENPAVTYRDLYMYCTKNTLGSHVKIVNTACFGNLYVASPQEFFVYTGQ